MYYDPGALGSLIPIWIIPKERTHNIPVKEIYSLLPKNIFKRDWGREEEPHSKYEDKTFGHSSCTRCLHLHLFHLVQHDDNFWPAVTNRKCISPRIGIYSNLMDTMDSIGTAFHPLIQQEWNFLNLSRIDKCTFPSESIRFQRIRWTPSERLSTPSSNMSEIFLCLSRIENELFHRNLFTSNGSNTLGRTLHH